MGTHVVAIGPGLESVRVMQREHIVITILTVSTLQWLSACGPMDTPAPSLTTSRQARPYPEETTASTDEENRFLVMADNQAHAFHGKPFWLRSGFMEHQSESTIRPPQLDVWGQETLEMALDADENAVVVHLGDAMDISCFSEFEDFKARMSNPTDREWFVAPGNHDGYFFGNISATASDEPEIRGWLKDDWERACADSRPMRKDDFLRAYLEVLGTRYQGLAAEMRRTRPIDPRQAQWSGEWQADWRCAREDCPALLTVSWFIDPKDNHKSYLVQRVRLDKSGFSAIVLDTSQYDRPRKPIKFVAKKLAGQVPGIEKDQEKVVRRWLQSPVPVRASVRQQRANGSPAQRASGFGRTVLMGHYDYKIGKHKGLVKSHRKRFMKRLEGLIQRSGVPLYFSAHTHKGGYKSQSGFLEINIGSILEWTPEYHLMSFREGPESLVLVDDLVRQRNSLDRASCPLHWRAVVGEPDEYVAYKEEANKKRPNHEQIKATVYNVMLAAYQRMLRCIAPSANRATCENPEVPLPAGSPAAEAYAELEVARTGSDQQQKADLLGQLAREEPRSQTRTARSSTVGTDDREVVSLRGVALDGETYWTYRRCQVNWAAAADKNGRDHRQFDWSVTIRRTGVVAPR